MTTAPTIYLPPAGDRPAEPAPYLMTDGEVVRMFRIEAADAGRSLKRLRSRGWLKGTRAGRHVRYLLPDVLACLERMHAEDAR